MEHALLGRGLGALRIVAEKLSKEEDVPQDTVQKLLGFFEVFGDRYHHIKEEHVLIPKLEDGCESRSRCHAGAMIGEIYYEHEVGRRMLASMKQVAEQLHDERGRRTFVKMAADYMGFMRNHVAKEKNSLIRSASKMLATEDRALERSFRDYAGREGIGETPQEFAFEIDRILADLLIIVPPPRGRAFSRGTIPYHSSTHSVPLRF